MPPLVKDDGEQLPPIRTLSAIAYFYKHTYYSIMFTSFPLTGFTSAFIFIVSIAAWVYLASKERQANTLTHGSLGYIRNYFLYMAIFGFFMTLPYLWLRSGPAAFSNPMAWGYVIGHIFLYIACLNVALMVCTLVPKLANAARIITILWVIFIVAITIINAKTMIWGIKPIFDTSLGLTELRASPIVGAGIGLQAAVGLLPAFILFAISAVKGNGPRRIKSSLLAAGFLIVIVGGPMHDLARTAGFYATADLLTTLGILLLGVGISYQLETSLVAMPDKSQYKVAPSNTV